MPITARWDVTKKWFMSWCIRFARLTIKLEVQRVPKYVASSNMNRFWLWHRCYWDSKQSKDSLLSHLNYNCISTTWRNRKLRNTEKLHVYLKDVCCFAVYTRTYGDSDVISSYHIYASCFPAIFGGKLC